MEGLGDKICMDIGRGAEAVVRKQENQVVKERLSKNYRLSEIDNRLRKFRTRREAKVLTKLAEIGIAAPLLSAMDDKNMKISMSFVEGPKLRDVLHEKPSEYSKEIGKKIGLMHKNDIIHADLTTSNMILSDEINLIDFGLSFFSTKIEDRAVDLHLLHRALESKHHDIHEQCFDAALEGYKETNPEAEQVLKRLEEVQLRGRHKKK